MIIMMGKSSETDKDNSFMAPQPINMQQPKLSNDHPKQQPMLADESVANNDSRQDKEISSKFKIDKQVDTLVKSPNTVVTAYFTLKSEYAKEEYQKWMSNMLAINDAMVIFTTPDLVK